MMRALRAPIVATFAFAFAGAAAAETNVLMLNRSENSNDRMVFEPNVVNISVGDTVTWLAADKGHNVEFIKGGIPEGVERFKSRLGKDATFTFTEPGVYAYKCTPHYGMGMIGFVIVGGDTSNLEAVENVRFPGKAKGRASKTLETLS